MLCAFGFTLGLSLCTFGLDLLSDGRIGGAMALPAESYQIFTAQIVLIARGTILPSGTSGPTGPDVMD